MRNALYYPHTQIREENFLKHALLTWDEVAYISPRIDFSFDDTPSHEFRDALELICRPHTPSGREKEIVHKRVVDLLNKGVPSWLITKQVPMSLKEGRPVREFYGSSYGMYPEKLDYRTWQLLETAGLVRLSGADYDYYTRPMLGFLLMSLLADACAGSQFEKITDRTDAYSFLWGLIANENKINPAKLSPSSLARNEAYSRLVSISIKTVNTDGVALSNILAMRMREAAAGGHDYTTFRHKYREKLEAHVTNLCTNVKTKTDRLEIERQFHSDMSNDLSVLRDELGVAKRDLVFSKEMLTMAVAAAGTLLEPISASLVLSSAAKTIAGGAMLKDVSNFSGTYGKALKNHPMSWLYLADNPSRDWPIRRWGLN